GLGALRFLVAFAEPLGVPAVVVARGDAPRHRKDLAKIGGATGGLGGGALQLAIELGVVKEQLHGPSPDANEAARHPGSPTSPPPVGWAARAAFHAAGPPRPPARRSGGGGGGPRRNLHPLDPLAERPARLRTSRVKCRFPAPPVRHGPDRWKAEARR